MLRIVCVSIAALVFAAAPAGKALATESGASQARQRAHAYSGLGSWVDLYNKRPWKHPARAVAGMARRGVQTIYLETSSYKFRKAIVHPVATGRYVDLAHESGMTVVAWYVPSFKPLKRDFRRALAALQYVSPSGGRFDSFALDIEATVVQNVTARNDRVKRLARAIRRASGADYPLGAIVPDPIGSVYWTDFPHEAVGRIFDVFMPMSYFTYRVDGATDVRNYVRANIRAVRERTGRSHALVHPIGGIADAARIREVRAYVGAVFREKALGGSLYDYPITRAAEWKPLQRLRSTRVVPPQSAAAPVGHRPAV